jgi:hypothetical protein
VYIFTKMLAQTHRVKKKKNTLFMGHHNTKSAKFLRKRDLGGYTVLDVALEKTR